MPRHRSKEQSLGSSIDPLHVLMHPSAQVLDVWKDAACEMSLQVVLAPLTVAAVARVYPSHHSYDSAVLFASMHALAHVHHAETEVSHAKSHPAGGGERVPSRRAPEAFHSRHAPCRACTHWPALSRALAWDCWRDKAGARPKGRARVRVGQSRRSQPRALGYCVSAVGCGVVSCRMVRMATCAGARLPDRGIRPCARDSD